MKNLQDVTVCAPLAFNNVAGLTTYIVEHDMLGRSRSKLALKPGVVRWCSDNLSQVPYLKQYRATRVNGRRVAGKVWLRFADEHDRTLFKLRFAHHFMPAALAHMPFGKELD